MAKKPVTLSIDDDLYVFFRVLNHEKYKLSHLVNDFLRSVKDCDSQNLDESKIIEDIDRLEEQEKDLSTQKMNLHAQLASLKAEKADKLKEEDERIRFTSETVRASGMLRDLI